MLVIKDGDQWLHVINYLAVVICFKTYSLKGYLLFLKTYLGTRGDLSKKLDAANETTC